MQWIIKKDILNSLIKKWVSKLKINNFAAVNNIFSWRLLSLYKIKQNK
jgi:hypothetical protein